LGGKRNVVLVVNITISESARKRRNRSGETSSEDDITEQDVTEFRQLISLLRYINTSCISYACWDTLRFTWACYKYLAVVSVNLLDLRRI
jgi:hypothetical protein